MLNSFCVGVSGSIALSRGDSLTVFCSVEIDCDEVAASPGLDRCPKLIDQAYDACQQAVVRELEKERTKAAGL